MCTKIRINWAQLIFQLNAFSSCKFGRNKLFCIHICHGLLCSVVFQREDLIDLTKWFIKQGSYNKCTFTDQKENLDSNVNSIVITDKCSLMFNGVFELLLTHIDIIINFSSTWIVNMLLHYRFRLLSWRHQIYFCKKLPLISPFTLGRVVNEPKYKVW